MTAPTLDGIRPAVAADLPAIMAVEVAGFPTGSWSAQSWADEVRHHHVGLAIRAGQVVGLVALSLVLDTAELRRIVVDPAVRRTGVGRALVDHGLAWAGAQGATEVFLEVSTANRPAIELYLACGFSRLDARRDYYGPGDDAAVWRRPIPITEEARCQNR
jgi:ribosomal-protein-alanine N-acetyltransferase